MKNFGVITLLAVLVSCGGSSGGSKKVENVQLDPVIVDKFEEEIRSRQVGMVTTETSKGTELYYSQVDGRWVVEKVSADYKETKTILNITDDTIFSLVEKTDKAGALMRREVRKESISKLIREVSAPLPSDYKITIDGTKVSLTGTTDTDFELDEGTKVSMIFNINASVDLNDVRCSERSETVEAGTMTQAGKRTELPQTGTSNIAGCGPTLSSAELKAIDLKVVNFCDESTDSDEVNCESDQDLSYLVQ